MFLHLEFLVTILCSYVCVIQKNLQAATHVLVCQYIIIIMIMAVFVYVRRMKQIKEPLLQVHLVSMVWLSWVPLHIQHQSRSAIICCSSLRRRTVQPTNRPMTGPSTAATQCARAMDNVWISAKASLPHKNRYSYSYTHQLIILTLLHAITQVKGGQWCDLGTFSYMQPVLHSMHMFSFFALVKIVAQLASQLQFQQKNQLAA